MEWGFRGIGAGMGSWPLSGGLADTISLILASRRRQALLLALLADQTFLPLQSLLKPPVLPPRRSTCPALLPAVFRLVRCLVQSSSRHHNLRPRRKVALRPWTLTRKTPVSTRHLFTKPADRFSPVGLWSCPSVPAIHLSGDLWCRSAEHCMCQRSASTHLFNHRHLVN